MAFAEAGILEQFSVVICGIIYPAYALIHFPGTRKRINNSESNRMSEYRTMLFIYTGLSIVVAVNVATGTPESMKIPEPRVAALTFFLLITAFIIVQFRQKLQQDDIRIIRSKMENIWLFLPKSRREYLYYISLSIAAAVSEELVFRYYLFHVLTDYGLSIWIAILACNILFALTHSRAGFENMISSFFLGLMFSLIYYFSGWIILPMLLHGAIEIAAGRTGIAVYNNLMNKQANHRTGIQAPGK
ncbi:MAG: CPBP family intramembrane metalloprotease [Cyclobacteriaceae bacterium]